MALNRYFQDELSYLRELGVLFAKANPSLAGFLAREAEDPDVERLLESFAFLTARLRQRVDDELPELSRDLLQLIYPQLLMPIPPMTVVAFEQKPGEAGTVIEAPRNTRVASQTVNGVSCVFTTRYRVPVHPFKVSAVRVDNRAASARLSIDLTATDRVDAPSLDGEPLRLHFTSDREPHVARALFLWLTRHARSVELEIEDGQTTTLGPEVIRPVGGGVGDDVIPAPARGFVGFRMLQEYLAIPSKFLFVDVDCFRGLDKTDARKFTLHVNTGRPFPGDVRVQTYHVVANASPAVNVFETDSYPLAISRARSQYRVVPTIEEQTIYRVDQAIGYVRGSNRRIHYSPFEAFAHDRKGATSPRHYFKTIPRPSVLRETLEIYITFVDGETHAIDPEADSVSLRVTASNGPVAHLLTAGMVNMPTGNTPSGLAVNNVATVTAEVPPPLTDREQWALLSSLARNFNSIVDVDRLRGVLTTFDFRARSDVTTRQRRDNLLQAIERMKVEPFDLFIDGRPTRSRRITLGVREDQIGGEGELYLFGSVINAFLSVYASVNAHHVFRIEGISSNAVYEWSPRLGEADPF